MPLGTHGRLLLAVFAGCATPPPPVAAGSLAPAPVPVAAAPAPSAPAPSAPAPVAAGALPDVDTPHRTAARVSGEAAVVIGVEDYFVLPDVPYASRDADLFHDLLVYTRGLPPAAVQRLVGSPVREQVLKAVQQASAAAGPDGTVWLYFAGHGAASPTDGARVLLGADVQADLDVFDSRSVRVDELTRAASAGGARVVLVTDACYSGRGRSGDALIEGKRFAVPQWAAASEPRVLEWSAAEASQWSGPLEGARHGAFTYAVVGALRGWADGQISGQPDGIVTAEEADLFVRDALLELGVRDQTPAMAVTGAADWALSSGTEARPALRGAAVAPAPVAAAPAPAPVAAVADGPAQSAVLGELQWLAQQRLWIMAHEVTQEQWRVYNGLHPSKGDFCASCPVNRVSWDEANAFSAWASRMDGVEYRLPTVDEWRAAAAGSDDDIDAAAWHSGNSGRTVHPVCEKARSPTGLCDLHGNVREWTSGGTRTQQSVGCSYAFNSSMCGTGSRFFSVGLSPAATESDLGFRLVRVP